MQRNNYTKNFFCAKKGKKKFCFITAVDFRLPEWLGDRRSSGTRPIVNQCTIIHWMPVVTHLWMKLN